MTESDKVIKGIHDFWNSRANLGLQAGTRDVVLKRLEIEAIAKYARDGMYILDAGCGNGITAIELARRYDVHVVGIDSAEEMIAEATNMAANQKLRGSARFQLGDVRDLSCFPEKFDMVYTERTLINLPNWPTQRKAIVDLGILLVDGGLYVMCESSQDGLGKINTMRGQLGLPEIAQPWHDRYFQDSEIQDANFPGVKLESVFDFSSTYYFLSRLVNAWLAAQAGKDPNYESPINQLALKLPPIGDIGQTKIWLWRKLA